MNLSASHILKKIELKKIETKKIAFCVLWPIVDVCICVFCVLFLLKIWFCLALFLYFFFFQKTIDYWIIRFFVCVKLHECLPEGALWVEQIEFKFDWMMQLSFKTIWHSLSVEVVDWLTRDWTSAASCFINEARSCLSNSCSGCRCLCCCFCCCLCNKADDNRVLSISSTSERSKNSYSFFAE